MADADGLGPEIESLFHQALERSEPDRETFLVELERRSPELGRAVRSLIKALVRGSDLLERSPFLTASTAAQSSARPRERIGRYTIVRELGRGGMGLVFLAADADLQRDIALKLLPDHASADESERAQLRREARILASLNHPNIATVFTLEEEDGRSFITMEWVPGMNLSEALEPGPLPVSQAIDVVCQVASGLRAAHARGIVHRDLKPSNIRLTGEGTAKILDFGIAKPVEALAERAERRDAESLPWLPRRVDPGVTVNSTSQRRIAGTPGYMSPEQIRGGEVDARADMFSLGCVLYECLTGRRACPGGSIEEIVRNTLSGEPDWNALPSSVSSAMVRLLRAMLEKDPGRRPADMSEVLQCMASRATSHEAGGEPAPRRWYRRASRRSMVLIALASTCVIVAIPIAIRPRPAGTALPLVRSFPLNFNCRAVALSPDGTQALYVGEDSQGDGQIFVRSVRSGAFRALTGTRGATDPVFSPDGEWIAFFAGGRLQKIQIAGGIPVSICAATGFGVGASWGDDGYIVFAPGLSGGLLRVSANGGAPEPFTRLDEASAEVSHRWPGRIPGSSAVVFTIKTANMESFDDARIGLVTRGGERHRILLLEATGAFHAAQGHLLFGRAGTLFDVPFDETQLRISGSPRMRLTGVRTDPLTGCVHAAASTSGSLLYVPGAPLWESSEPVRVTRDGRVAPFMVRAAPWADPRISPTGRQVLFTRFGANDRIWLVDGITGTCRRISSGPGNDQRAVWSPDETAIAFESDRDGLHGIYTTELGRPGVAVPLVVGHDIVTPTSWSTDGRWIAYTRQTAENGTDVYARSSDGRQVPVRASRSNESEGSISPDTRWIAYESNESGRPEVYVCRFPDGDDDQMISDGGGSAPLWSRGGREIVFRRGRTVLSMAVSTTPMFRIEAPAKELFEHTIERGYDASPDGSYFLMLAWPISAMEAPRFISEWQRK